MGYMSIFRGEAYAQGIEAGQLDLWTERILFAESIEELMADT